MRRQGNVAVGCVGLGHVRNEIVEAAVVGFSYGPDPFKEALGVDGVVEWGAIHKDKTMSHLYHELA